MDWLTLHIHLMHLGYAACLAACATGGVYLLLESQLKLKALGPLVRMLPSLGVLDAVHTAALVAGFITLTAGLYCGYAGKAAWAVPSPALSLKEMVGILTWVAYGWLLGARTVSHYSGHRIMVWSLVAFTFLLFGYYGVDQVSAGWHTF